MLPSRKKRWGQHHLRQGSLCAPMIDFLRPLGGPVVEIGPGGGVLTEGLLAAGGQVLACEIDPEWAVAVRRRLGGERLAIAVADALDLAWERLPAGSLVTGNLPYNVATALIERILRRGAGVERAAFMVQLEVGRRLTATPGSPDYGSLTLLVQAWAEARMLGRIRAASFAPPPKVDGAMVGLARRPPPLPRDRMDGLIALIRLAFARRRKTLRNALAAAWGRPGADRVLAAAGLTAKTRAESLPLDSFVRLHEVAEEAGMIWS